MRKIHKYHFVPTASKHRLVMALLMQQFLLVIIMELTSVIMEHMWLVLLLVMAIIMMVLPVGQTLSLFKCLLVLTIRTIVIQIQPPV